MFVIDVKRCLRKNSRSTCGNILFKKEIENCLVMKHVVKIQEIRKTCNNLANCLILFTRLSKCHPCESFPKRNSKITKGCK